MPTATHQLEEEIALDEVRVLTEKRAFHNAIVYSIGMKNVTYFSWLYEARFGKKPSSDFRG